MGEFTSGWTPLAPDLIGHGRSEAPDLPSPYGIERVVEQLRGMLDRLDIESAHWVGYSMGGRVLLNFAVRHPGRVQTMVLESTTAGLEGSEARKRRRRKDDKLAELLETESLEAFVDRWLSASVFDSQKDLPDTKREWARELRLENDPVGLAHCLRELGRGSVPPVWDRLDDLDIPVFLITGRTDEKHVKIHGRLEETLPNADSEFVEDAGHNVHFETPGVYVEKTRSFFDSV